MSDVLAADLTAERIEQRLRTERFGRSLDVRASTDSTMDDAAKAAEASAPDGHTVVADRQRQGRGAHGRTWLSPGGTDLYLSIVCRPTIDVAHRALVTLATGLGVADAAEKLTGVAARVKWPNDVWLRGNKCAGVLTETSTRGKQADALIIGIGLDVNRRHWPTELRGLVRSLAEARGDGRDVDRAEALAETLLAVEQWVDRLVTEGPAPVVEALDRRLALRGATVSCDGVEGVLEGVARSGAALIRTAQGVREVLAGTLVEKP